MLRRLYEGQVAAGELRSMFEDLSFDTMTRMVFGKRYHGRDPNVTVEESRVFRCTYGKGGARASWEVVFGGLFSDFPEGRCSCRVLSMSAENSWLRSRVR